MFAFSLLVVAAFLAGIINSIAGGGSFLTFPSLVFAGVPPVIANASNTVALVPSAIASGFSYRSDIEAVSHRYHLRAWFAVSFFGGLIGAVLLLYTSDHTFRYLAPWLLLFATLLFAFGQQVSTVLRGKLESSNTAMLLLLFVIAIYGGYFGGGIGIMILAAMRLYGMSDIHSMNGIKTVLSAVLNAVAALIFIAKGIVWWPQTMVMLVAGIVGGWVGPMLARRLAPATIRRIVIGVGVVMTVYFFRQVPG